MAVDADLPDLSPYVFSITSVALDDNMVGEARPEIDEYLGQNHRPDFVAYYCRAALAYGEGRTDEALQWMDKALSNLEVGNVEMEKRYRLLLRIMNSRILAKAGRLHECHEELAGCLDYARQNQLAEGITDVYSELCDFFR